MPSSLLPRHVERSARPSDKCFGLAFKTKMKIYDAAHVQALELSDSGYQYTGNKSDQKHIFLTPTFDMNDPGSFVGSGANDALKRFTNNIKQVYSATSYVWVKEFTENLTPHFHMLVTMPFTPIDKLNRAWSHARGDVTTVTNALRTGWNPKTKKSVMLVRNYKQAVGYAAKYISKSHGGDICVLKPSCNVRDRKTWEFNTGHSTKCYGMSQNLVRPPREVDFFLEMHLNPYMKSHYEGVKTDFAELFFSDSPVVSSKLYQLGKEKVKCKPVKIEKFSPKIPNYTVFDQLRIEFSRQF